MSDLNVSKFIKDVIFSFELSRAEAGIFVMKGPDRQ